MDDGSVDGTLEKLRLWAIRDDRIRMISRENRGLIVTLNELVAHSTGRYSARMDADDYCHADRIRLQVLALNGGLAMVGSNCFVVDEASHVVGSYKFEKRHSQIDVDGLFRVQFCHPSVIFDMQKIKMADLYYDPVYRHAEDLELWFRLLQKYKCGNLGVNLLYLRRGHATNVSSVHAKEQFVNTVDIVARYAGVKISSEDVLNLRQRENVFMFARSGARVGRALLNNSFMRGMFFFRKLSLILMVASARKLAGGWWR